MFQIKNIVVFFIVAGTKIVDVRASTHFTCHTETNTPVVELHDGRLGETSTFPWLGLLEVSIHDEGTPITALTGIVFVTHTHALANSDDIAKMPSWIFKGRTKAIFIPIHGKLRYYNLVDYVTHPEYKNPTINTIALVTLLSEIGAKLPEPICWNREAYNNNDHLFVVGFTDEFVGIEKFIHRSRLVDDISCKNFYVKEGLNDVLRLPINYHCVSTVNENNTCVWDTGMALVSNSTGHWVLVGFGIYGPGCSVPARFIKLLPYYQWIRTTLNLQSPRTESSRRFEGFQSNSESKGSHRSKPSKEIFQNYYRVERISHQTVIIAINANSPRRDCNELIFSEHKNIISTSQKPKKLKSVSYKLTLYDLYRENVTCVYVSLIAENYTNAYLYIEDSSLHQQDVLGWVETPLLIQRQILKSIKKNSTSTIYKPFLQYPHYGEFDDNNLIYFKFQFEGEARFVVKLFRRLPTVDVANKPDIVY